MEGNREESNSPHENLKAILRSLDCSSDEDLLQRSVGSSWSQLWAPTDQSIEVDRLLPSSQEEPATEKRDRAMAALATSLLRMNALTSGGPMRGPVIRGVPKAIIPEVSPLLAHVVCSIEKEHEPTIVTQQGQGASERLLSVVGQLLTISLAASFPVSTDEYEAYYHENGMRSEDDDTVAGQKERYQDRFEHLVASACASGYSRKLPLYFFDAGKEEEEPYRTWSYDEEDDEDDVEMLKISEDINSTAHIVIPPGDEDARILKRAGVRDVHFNPTVIASFFHDSFIVNNGMVVIWLATVIGLHEAKSVSNFCDMVGNIFRTLEILIATPLVGDEFLRLHFNLKNCVDLVQAGGRTASERTISELAHHQGPLLSSEEEFFILKNKLMTSTEPGHLLRGACDLATKLFNLMPIATLKLLENPNASQDVPYFDGEIRRALLPWARDVQRVVYQILLLTSPGQRAEVYALDIKGIYAEVDIEGMPIGVAHPLKEKRQRRLFNLPLSQTTIEVLILFVLGARKVLVGFNRPDESSLFISLAFVYAPGSTSQLAGKPYEKIQSIGQDSRRAANDYYFMETGTNSKFAAKKASDTGYDRRGHVSTGFPNISASTLRTTVLTRLLDANNADTLRALGPAGSMEVIAALYNTSPEVIDSHYKKQGISSEEKPEMLTAWLTEGTVTSAMIDFVNSFRSTAVAELDDIEKGSLSLVCGQSNPSAVVSPNAGLVHAEIPANPGETRKMNYNCPPHLLGRTSPTAALSQSLGRTLAAALKPFVSTDVVKRKIFHTERRDGQLFRVDAPHSQWNTSCTESTCSARPLNTDAGQLLSSTSFATQQCMTRAQAFVVARFLEKQKEE